MQENQKRKKMKDDIWDISIYTDEEIVHNLLNMSNPTDRELEIKIWSSIQQYKTSPPTPENLRWMNFYEQIYHRLFSFSDDEEESDKVIHKPVGLELTESFELIEGIETQITSKAPTTTPKNSNPKTEENTDDSTKSTKLVTQLQYATGNINPLLKETISRTLTIDSQYRDNKNEPTTSFILNLTETIKNVVNISLYSIHIPFTWYTISNNYGSNYFYIRGTSPGIENYEYKITIESGNYTQLTLASAINVSLQTIKTNNTDICFGNTRIEYNPNNTLMTLFVDIQNIFDQHYYYLSFLNNPLQDYSGNISLTDPSYILMRKSTIPSFLGIKDVSYNFDNVYSKTFPYTTSTSSIYTISDITDISNNIYPNNQIWIYQYQGIGLFDPSNSIILATYSITIPKGNYSRTSLTTVVDNLIHTSTFLDTTVSHFEQIQLHDANNNAYFDFNLELNRNTTINQQYLKTVILLPDDTLNNDIWTGTCFQFPPRYSSFPINPNNSTTSIGPYFPFYQNEIYSEYPTLNTNYSIDASVCIIFKCNTPYYNVPENSFFLKIVPNKTGYILPDYATAINNAFNNIYDITTGLEISANQIFNQTINNPFVIGPTDSIPYFDFDMNRTFTTNMYSIDISNSSLYKKLNIGKYNGTGDGIINLIDISSNGYRIDFSFNNSAVIDMSCDTLLTVYPKPYTNYGNQNAPPFIVYPTYINNNNDKLYTNINILSTDLQTAFTNFTSNILNENPIEKIKININPTLQISNIGEEYFNGNIIFSVNSTLTETNYSVAFYDPLETWSVYLHFEDNSGTYLNTDISYSLSNYNVSGQSYSQIKGDNVILNERITIDNSNNKFSIIPLTSSISLQSNYNNYNYTIPVGVYTRDQLLNAINTAFQSYKDTYNSYIQLKTINGKQNSYFYIGINKVLTSSDYSLVFYDSKNFQQCALGKTNTGNASWDSTLGWILGFREYTTYELSNFISIPGTFPSQTNPTPSFNDICKIVADTTCSTTLFNYFILTLDDFNQNHTNDGLVTITTTILCQ